MNNWWEIEDGYPIKDSGLVIEPEEDFEREVWLCGVCYALITTPTKHIRWHQAQEIKE